MPVNPYAAVRVLGKGAGPWVRTAVRNASPCPVWNHHAIFALPSDRLGDDGRRSVAVMVKLYSLGDDGDDLPIGEVRVEVPLTFGALAHAAQGSGSAALKPGLEPSLQVVHDHASFAIESRRRREHGAAAIVDVSL